MNLKEIWTISYAGQGRTGRNAQEISDQGSRDAMDF